MKRRVLRRSGLATMRLIVVATAIAALGAASTTIASAAPKASSQKLKKVAILIPGSINDHGYDSTGNIAGKLIRKAFGAHVAVVPIADTTTQNADYQSFAQQGYNLIIGWGGQFQDGAVAEAPKFPKVDFLCVNCTAKNGKNLASVNENSQRWEFVAGWLLAELSKTSTVGLIGAQCFPSTALTMNGLEQGVKYAKPGDKVLMTYDGTFENPTVAQQAANSMASEGAGAFSGNLNNGWYGVYKSAESHGDLPVINEWLNSANVAPKVIASSVLKGMQKFTLGIARKVANGTFRGKIYTYDLTASDGPAISKTKLVPKSLYTKALAIQKKVEHRQIPVKADTSCPK